MNILAIFSILILISVIDLRTFRIPDVLLSYILLFGVCADIAQWDQVSITYRILSACFVLFAFIAVQKVFGSFGFGDVKLVAVLTYVFGLLDFLSAFLISAVVFLFAYCITARRLRWPIKTKIPFAPFLLAGYAIVSVMRGVIMYE